MVPHSREALTAVRHVAIHQRVCGVVLYQHGVELHSAVPTLVARVDKLDEDQQVNIYISGLLEHLNGATQQGGIDMPSSSTTTPFFQSTLLPQVDKGPAFARAYRSCRQWRNPTWSQTSLEQSTLQGFQVAKYLTWWSSIVSAFDLTMSNSLARVTVQALVLH